MRDLSLLQLCYEPGLQGIWLPLGLSLAAWVTLRSSTYLLPSLAPRIMMRPTGHIFTGGGRFWKSRTWHANASGFLSGDFYSHGQQNARLGLLKHGRAPACKPMAGTRMHAGYLYMSTHLRHEKGLQGVGGGERGLEPQGLPSRLAPATSPLCGPGRVTSHLCVPAPSPVNESS